MHAPIVTLGDARLAVCCPRAPAHARPLARRERPWTALPSNGACERVATAAESAFSLAGEIARSPGLRQPGRAR